MEAAQDRLTPLDIRLRQFEQLLASDPDNPSTLLAYGQASHLRGRLLEALKSYQRLTALQPDVPDHALALGRVYLDSGLPHEAWATLAPVLRAIPTHLEGQLLLRRLSRAQELDAVVATPLADSERLLPERDALATHRARVEAEMGVLDAEIESLLAQAASHPGEPAIEFSSCLARERQDRLRETLTALGVWEARHQVLDEERQRQEEASRREQEEADLRRLEEERVRREQEEQARLEAEEEARLRHAQEEQARLEAEEEARRRQEAEEAQRGARVREEAYAALGQQLSPVVSGLMKTKGVSAVLVVARDGFLVHETHAQELDLASLSSFVVDGIGMLMSSGEGLGQWKTWVLEFAKGILVLHRVTDDYFLLIHGQTGANFGLLTLFIDKNRGQLESILGQAPTVS